MGASLILSVKSSPHFTCAHDASCLLIKPEQGTREHVSASGHALVYYYTHKVNVAGVNPRCSQDVHEPLHCFGFLLLNRSGYSYLCDDHNALKSLISPTCRPPSLKKKTTQNGATHFSVLSWTLSFVVYSFFDLLHLSWKDHRYLDEMVDKTATCSTCGTFLNALQVSWQKQTVSGHMYCIIWRSL